MTENFNPDTDSNLTAVKLCDLLNSERVELFTDGSFSWGLVDKSDNITFYVAKETNLSVPLRIGLSLEIQDTLIPNQPISALKYEQISKKPFNICYGGYNGQGVILPFGYNFEQLRRNLIGDPYFNDANSGWKTDSEDVPLLLGSQTNVEVVEDGLFKSSSIVRYKP